MRGARPGVGLGLPQAGAAPAGHVLHRFPFPISPTRSQAVACAGGAARTHLAASPKKSSSIECLVEAEHCCVLLQIRRTGMRTWSTRSRTSPTSSLWRPLTSLSRWAASCTLRKQVRRRRLVGGWTSARCTNAPTLLSHSHHLTSQLNKPARCLPLWPLCVQKLA